MTVRVEFEPRDLWLGVFVDTDQRRLYICIIPCVPIVVDLSCPRGLERERDEAREDYFEARRQLNVVCEMLDEEVRGHEDAKAHLTRALEELREEVHKWEREKSLRLDKAGSGSDAVWFADGRIAGLRSALAFLPKSKESQEAAHRHLRVAAPSYIRSSPSGDHDGREDDAFS